MVIYYGNRGEKTLKLVIENQNMSFNITLIEEGGGKECRN